MYASLRGGRSGEDHRRPDCASTWVARGDADGLSGCANDHPFHLRPVVGWVSRAPGGSRCLVRPTLTLARIPLSFPETSLATSGRSGSHRTPRAVLMSRARLVAWVGNHPVFWPTTRTRHVPGASADEGWQLSERVRRRGWLELPRMPAFHSPARSRNS